LAEAHILDPWPLDEGPKPKSGKSRLNLYMAPFYREYQLVWTQKKELVRRAHDLENQDAS
jgi:hypothetical protein